MGEDGALAIFMSDTFFQPHVVQKLLGLFDIYSSVTRHVYPPVFAVKEFSLLPQNMMVHPLLQLVTLNLFCFLSSH